LWVALTYRGNFAWIYAILIAGCVVLSGSKILIYGTPLVIATSFFFHPPSRSQVLRICFSLILLLLVYWSIFPGIASYTLSSKLLLESIYIRLNNFSCSLAELTYGFFSNTTACLNLDKVEYIELKNEAFTLFTKAIQYPLNSLMILIVIILIAYKYKEVSSTEQLRRDLILVLAMLLAAMVADVSGWLIYWYFLGWAGRHIFGQLFIARDPFRIRT
jgi:hypothetical protein